MFRVEIYIAAILVFSTYASFFKCFEFPRCDDGVSGARLPYGQYQYNQAPTYYTPQQNYYYSQPQYYQPASPLAGYCYDDRGNLMTGTNEAGFYITCEGRCLSGRG